jgi:hypothetical protein
MMQQANRQVRFCETEQVKVVETVDNNDETSSVWYTRHDLANARSEDCSCKKQRRHLDKAEETPLMCICQLISDADRQRQRDFVMALLQQQVEHKQLGLQDPKGLFQLSRACTKKSRQQALQQGRQHEKEVLEESAIDDALDVLLLQQDLFAEKSSPAVLKNCF